MSITREHADNMTYAQLQRLYTIAKQGADGMLEAFAAAYNMGYDAAINDQTEQGEQE